MPTQIIQSYIATNPLIGLSPTALRLYNALEVFRKVYRSRNNREWFRVPQRDKRLEDIGFSKEEIHQGLTELVNAGLLLMWKECHIEWYQLK